MWQSHQVNHRDDTAGNGTVPSRRAGDYDGDGRTADTGFCCRCPYDVRFEPDGRTAPLAHAVMNIMRDTDNAADTYWDSDWLGWSWTPATIG